MQQRAKCCWCKATAPSCWHQKDHLCSVSNRRCRVPNLILLLKPSLPLMSPRQAPHSLPLPPTTHAIPQFPNPSTLHTSPSSPPPKKLLTASSIPHTLHPFPQQAQTRANAKYARLMASTPASMFDCSDLFDANRLVAVIRRAVDHHPGCACACALVCLCVCPRSR